MLWQKGTKVEDWVTRFTVGEDYRWDTYLLPYDIEATEAHAWGLEQIGILTQKEMKEIQKTLQDLREAAEQGRVTVRPEDEDCHTVIEEFLTEHLGDVGKKIHTGRSRNDQVLAALRLFLRSGLQHIGGETAGLAEASCSLGERYADALMPGYTHYQRAMPTTAGLWALGYAELLASDLEALRSAYEQINVSPLGSAAGYGVPYLDLPRVDVAERLGFAGVQTHVTAVQLSRGKLELHVVHALVQVAATINRMASDLVLFNSAEFGFVELPPEFCTGSSIMPQKQNPDVFELARAYYHRLTSEMHLLMSLPANLPSGYHRDLQLTKEAAMRSVLLAQDLVTAMRQGISGVRFNTERMRAALSPDLFATAHALEQVKKGVPFREAYRNSAKAVNGWQVPDANEALAAYTVNGFPGRQRPDLVRARLEASRAWFE